MAILVFKPHVDITQPGRTLTPQVFIATISTHDNHSTVKVREILQPCLKKAQGGKTKAAVNYPTLNTEKKVH